MRILIIDIECMGLDAALRFADADHEVFWHINSKKPVRDGEGFKNITIVDEWKTYMPKCKDGLIMCTGNHKFLPDLDRYREHGYKIFAPTAASATLEIERSAGMEAMKAAGIEVPPYKVFDSLQSAAKFARKSDKAWVHKPMGDEEDKSLTYVSSDPADLVGWLDRQIARGAKLKGKVMLQQKVDALCELGVSGWFGPDGFLPEKFQACIEHKKQYAGELGQNVGEQGTICQYMETDKLADEMLLPMTSALQKLGHRGDFAVGAMIDKNGKAWPLEFTARFGFPAWFIQVASHKGDPAKWMRALLDGKDSLKVSYDVAIGVVLSQPPYPSNDGKPEDVEGNPISGLDDVYDDIHCASVMLGTGPIMKDGKVVDGPTYQTTGAYVACATALGKTVERARKKVYSTIDALAYANIGYRNDIGCKLEKVLPKLHEFGYLPEMNFD